MAPLAGVADSERALDDAADRPVRIDGHACLRGNLASGGEAGLRVGLIAVIAVATGLAAGAALWAGSDDDGGGDPASVAAASDLYVVDGRLASARSTGPGTLEVGLEGAAVLWFSDRPARLHGNRPVRQFVAQWPSTFGTDPPNAAVLAPSDEQSRPPLAVELQRPHFDRSTGVVRFVLRPERGSKDRAARWLATLHRAARSGLDRLVLFVDNGVLPGPAPGPAVAAAFAEGEQAIGVLQSAVAGGGTLSAQAAEDLEALQQQAATDR